MKGGALDFYCAGTSPLHRLDARVKLVVTVAYIASASLLPPRYWPGYLGLAVLVFGAIGLSRVPLRVALQRSLVAVPFALMAAASLPFTRPGPVLVSVGIGPWQLVATIPGLAAALEVLGRSWLSLLAAGLLAATTPFGELAAALRALGLPALLVALIWALFRYLFVLVEEAGRLWRAREARSAQGPMGGGGRVGWRARVLGGMVGSLFVRSYERSERVYQAMLARGFDGEVRAPAPRPLSPADWRAGVATVLALAGLVLTGHWLWRSG